jgi:hypothetical protein
MKEITLKPGDDLTHVAVAHAGKISGTGKTQQHCYATRFIDGTMVYVRLNKSGSEQFTVQASTPNPRVDGTADEQTKKEQGT